MNSSGHRETAAGGLRCEAARICHNRWVGWLVRLAFGTAALLVLFTRVDVADVQRGLRLVRPTTILLCLVIYLLVRLLLAWQMSLGLGRLGMPLAVRDVFQIKLIASFYSLLLPGDLVAGGVAWYKLSKPSGKGIEAGALLVYFRLVNTLVLLAVGLSGLWLDPLLSFSRLRAAVAVMLGAVIVLLLPFLKPAPLGLIRSRARWLLGHVAVPAWVRKKGNTAWNAVHAFHTLSSLRDGLLVLGLSILSEALGVVSYCVVARAVGIHVPLPALAWIRSLLSIVQLLPVSIAGLGVREASLVFLLGSHGVAEARALSFSLANLAVLAIGGSLGGALEAWQLLFSGRRDGRSP